jgi:uncharacterized protein (TIGR02453 family)
MDKGYAGAFNGFSAETLEFLKSLGENNNKQWFLQHKSDYERCLLFPMQNLVKDLGPYMLSIDPFLEIRPAVDKTISRIYRDTRFSKDKSPLRANMWITFKRYRKDWKDWPSFYLELFPDWYRYGMGYYSPSKDTMDSFRRSIIDKPDKFHSAISFSNNGKDFIVEGEKYKKILNSDVPEEDLEWYQWKYFYVTCNRKADDLLYSKELVKLLIDGFNTLAPFYHYLWEL